MDFDELDEVVDAAPNALELYMKACDVGGGSLEYPEEYTSLMRQAAEAAGGDPEAPASVKKVLEMMSYAAIHSLEARKLSSMDEDDEVFNSFLALIRRSVTAPGMPLVIEAVALKKRRCTGQMFPNIALHQLVFTGMCATCYVQGRAAQEPLLGDGIWAAAYCQCGDSIQGMNDSGSEELMTLVDAVLDGSQEEIPRSLPLPWKRLLGHLMLSQSLPDARALGSSEWEQLRKLHHPSPPIKLKTYQSSSLGPEGRSRLVLILHGAMNRMKQNDFIYTCIFKMGSPFAAAAEIIGIEFDYRHNGWGEMEGYSCERPEHFISRQGEMALQAVRVYQQCIEAHLSRNPGCKTIDIIAFSAGAYLAYILLCLAPSNAERFRIGSLTLLSARLEEPAMVADKLFLKRQLDAHNTSVFLGWGDLEDGKEAATPFTSISTAMKKLLPASKIQTRAYVGQGHTMTPEELLDVQAFLRTAWSDQK